MSAFENNNDNHAINYYYYEKSIIPQIKFMAQAMNDQKLSAAMTGNQHKEKCRHIDPPKEIIVTERHASYK